MNSFKLAYKLLRNNLKIYELYFLVLVVTIATYYNFAAIQYNTSYVKIAMRLQSAVVASITCGFILICTVVFFMWHANGFFFKQRQKETGLYMLMGISSSKIGKVYAIETLLLGTLSLLIGLSIGTLFSKLFFMLLGKAVAIETEVPFSISPKAILQLIIVFVTVFIILGINNFIVVKKSQLIKMLNATKEKSPVPKLNYFKSILGVILIIGGYIIGINVRRQEIDLLIASMSTLIMVSIGTYFIFESLISIILCKLIKCKKIIYKNVRLVSISNIVFRLKINYRTLAMTAILAASTISVLSISLSFKQLSNSHIVMEVPYSFSYISNDINTKNKVNEIINKSSHKLLGSNAVTFGICNIEYLRKDKKVDNKNIAIITSFSQIEKTLEFLNYKNRKTILKQIKPNKNEVTFSLNATTMASPIYVKGEKVRISGNEYLIKEDLKVPFTGNSSMLGNKNIYILLDSEYEKLKANFEEQTLNGVLITEPQNNMELLQNITEIVPGGSENVNPYKAQYIWEYYALGVFFYLGLIMTIVFMLATFSTLYFKILSHALMDREQYAILKKVGMSKKEVIKSVNMQVGMEFVLPSIVGIIHSVFAMIMLQELINVQFVQQTLCSIGLFIIVIIIFYFAISANYTKMVYDE